MRHGDHDTHAHTQVIANELEFISKQAKGQQAKGRARQRRYEEKVEEANSFVKNTQVTCAQLLGGEAERACVHMCQSKELALSTAWQSCACVGHPHSPARSPNTQVDSITIPVGPRLGGKVVEFNGVSKAFGDKLLLDDLTFSVPPGEEETSAQCCTAPTHAGLNCAVLPTRTQALSLASSVATALER